MMEKCFDDVKHIVYLFSFLSVLKILQTVRTPGQRQAIGIEVRVSLFLGRLSHLLRMSTG